MNFLYKFFLQNFIKLNLFFLNFKIKKYCYLLRKTLFFFNFQIKKIIKKIKELIEFCYIFNYYKNLNYKFDLTY